MYFPGSDDLLEVYQTAEFGGATEDSPLVEVDLFTVRDGKITSLRSMYGVDTLGKFGKLLPTESISAYAAAWSSGDAKQVEGSASGPLSSLARVCHSGCSRGRETQSPRGGPCGRLNAEVIAVEWFGSDTVEVTFRSDDGVVGQRLQSRSDESRLVVAAAEKPWTLDADGDLFKLVSEARRIELAYQADPFIAAETQSIPCPTRSRPSTSECFHSNRCVFCLRTIQVRARP